MKNLRTIQKNIRLVCIWIQADRPGQPLFCRWVEASKTSAVETALSTSNEGRVQLCA